MQVTQASEAAKLANMDHFSTNGADGANIAQMSCNPAMGGIAKGQGVEDRRVGGYSGLVGDSSTVFKF